MSELLEILASDERLGQDMRSYGEFCRWKGLLEHAFESANEVGDAFQMAQIGNWNEELEATSPKAAKLYEEDRLKALGAAAVPEQR